MQTAPHVAVDVGKHEVRVDAVVCMTDGPLEQAVCMPMTREHESLLVALARPSDIHAALLLAGATSGHPASWTANDSGGFDFVPPEGDALEISVQWEDQSVPLHTWIRPVQAPNASAPPMTFLFCGSMFRPNSVSMGPGEHYVANFTGSVIGLVTFGDEVIGLVQVVPDQVEVAPTTWEAWTERIPALGTKVTLVVRLAPCSRG
ncbi:MAG: hypothetical protein EXS00_08080 [Phycisphaerales bacterium]|nr:hypothetical protein [Phycisphaerales bacterium]